jgi:UrcA family protein
MKTRRFLQTAVPAILVAGLCLTGSALADELPTITIGAGVTTKSVVGHSAIGAPIEEVTITHRVSYADLDLTKTADAAELRRRVQETARAACRQLDALYPLEAKNARECTRNAIARASSQVDNAIEGAIREAKAQ